MLRRSLALGAVLMTYLVISGSLSSGADPAVKVDQPDFSGKIVYVETSDKSQPTYLESPKIRVLGGRTFLVGPYGKHASIAEFPDAVYWIPVDQAKLMMEFKNMDDAFKAATSRKPVDR